MAKRNSSDVQALTRPSSISAIRSPGVSMVSPRVQQPSMANVSTANILLDLLSKVSQTFVTNRQQNTHAQEEQHKLDVMKGAMGIESIGLSKDQMRSYTEGNGVAKGIKVKEIMEQQLQGIDNPSKVQGVYENAVQQIFGTNVISSDEYAGAAQYLMEAKVMGEAKSEGLKAQMILNNLSSNAYTVGLEYMRNNTFNTDVKVQMQKDKRFNGLSAGAITEALYSAAGAFAAEQLSTELPKSLESNDIDSLLSIKTTAIKPLKELLLKDATGFHLGSMHKSQLRKNILATIESVDAEYNRVLSEYQKDNTAKNKAAFSKLAGDVSLGLVDPDEATKVLSLFSGKVENSDIESVVDIIREVKEGTRIPDNPEVRATLDKLLQVKDYSTMSEVLDAARGRLISSKTYTEYSKVISSQRSQEESQDKAASRQTTAIENSAKRAEAIQALRNLNEVKRFNHERMQSNLQHLDRAIVSLSQSDEYSDLYDSATVQKALAHTHNKLLEDVVAANKSGEEIQFNYDVLESMVFEQLPKLRETPEENKKPEPQTREQQKETLRKLEQVRERIRALGGARSGR